MFAPTALHVSPTQTKNMRFDYPYPTPTRRRSHPVGFGRGIADTSPQTSVAGISEFSGGGPSHHARSLRACLWGLAFQGGSPGLNAFSGIPEARRFVDLMQKTRKHNDFLGVLAFEHCDCNVAAENGCAVCFFFVVSWSCGNIFLLFARVRTAKRSSGGFCKLNQPIGESRSFRPPRPVPWPGAVPTFREEKPTESPPWRAPAKPTARKRVPPSKPGVPTPRQARSESHRGSPD